MENIELTNLKKDDDWFDDYAVNYVATTPVIQEIPKGWFGKSEILSWEFYELDKKDFTPDEDGICEWYIYENLNDIFSNEVWNIKDLESEGCFFIKEDIDNLYQLKGYEDIFMYDFGDKKSLFSVYQIGDIHKRKNIITLSGWDYNIIIDMVDKTIETHYTR